MTKVELENHRELWRERVAAFRGSGLSGAAWCAANQVKDHQLWYWSAKFPIEKPVKQTASGWVMVQPHEPVAAAEHPLLVRIGQATIEVKAGYDPELLRDVVHTLAALC